MRKFSQDHVEMFFCHVRAALGSNDNPSAYEFRNAMRRLLYGYVKFTSDGANVLLEVSVGIYCKKDMADCSTVTKQKLLFCDSGRRRFRREDGSTGKVFGTATGFDQYWAC